MLQGAASNQNGGQIAKVEGERDVQYGMLQEGGDGTAGLQRTDKLVFASEGMVKKPTGKHLTPREYYGLLRARTPRRRRRSGQAKNFPRGKLDREEAV